MLKEGIVSKKKNNFRIWYSIYKLNYEIHNKILDSFYFFLLLSKQQIMRKFIWTAL